MGRKFTELTVCSAYMASLVAGMCAVLVVMGRISGLVMKLDISIVIIWYHVFGGGMIMGAFWYMSGKFSSALTSFMGLLGEIHDDAEG